MPAALFSSLPTATAFQTAGSSCPEDGLMVWKKTPDGLNDQYSLCYAPSVVMGPWGPSGGQLRCEAGTYFTIAAPKFCCENPRQVLNGQVFHSDGDLCGDVLAHFDPAEQSIKFARGPSSAATEKQLGDLEKAGLGETAPSPLALSLPIPTKTYAVKTVNCKGRDGTLVKWPGDNSGKEKAELCPPGTSPVVPGASNMSWLCDGTYLNENRMHCCKVGKSYRCVSSLRDLTDSSDCNCGGLGARPQTSDGSEAEPKEDKVATASLSALVPLVVLRPASGQPCREAGGCGDDNCRSCHFRRAAPARRARHIARHNFL